MSGDEHRFLTRGEWEERVLRIPTGWRWRRLRFRAWLRDHLRMRPFGRRGVPR